MTETPLPETEELLKRAACGEKAARSLLFQKSRERLKRMARVRLDQRLQARFDPSDVVQETLLIADQKLDEFMRDRPVPYYVWLRRIAWEQLVKLNEKHVQAHRRSVLREVDLQSMATEHGVALLADHLAQSHTHPAHHLVQQEMKQRLRSALDSLNESDRELLCLRYLEQVPIAEIAIILGCTEGVVRTRHTRAIRRLQKAIDSIATD